MNLEFNNNCNQRVDNPSRKKVAMVARQMAAFFFRGVFTALFLYDLPLLCYNKNISSKIGGVKCQRKEHT